MQSDDFTDHHLYCVTVGCPACNEVSQFVRVTDAPVPVDADLLVPASHCPHCGVHIPAVGEWDLHAEHEVTTRD